MSALEERKPFADLTDLVMIWGEPENGGRDINQILLIVSDGLRIEAEKVGKNLDDMINKNPALALVAKSVVVDVVGRYLATSTHQEPMTQVSQSAGGYTVSGTYLVPGGGIFIKRSELARLGLRRQKMGGIDFYGFSD